MTLTRRAALAAAPAALLGARPARADRPQLKIATFETDVTIPLGHPCMGGGVAPAKEVIDPLLAHGFVLLGAGKPVCVLALDWCEVRNGAYDALRAAVARAIDTDPVRVMACALHQHDAPIFDLEGQQILEKHKAKGAICDLAFFEKAVARLAAIAKACLKDAKPVTHVGTGEAKVEQVASNRRYTDAAGTVRHNRTSATRDAAVRAADGGTIDQRLKTISFWNGDAPLCALSAYATHPMSYYGRGGVTADFVGAARRKHQAETRAFQMYASGCSGNVTAGKYNDGDPANRAVLAERIRAGMAAAWKATERVPVKAATFRNTELTLEPRSSKGFSEEELLSKLKDAPRPFGQCLAALGLSWKKRCAAGKPIDVPVLDFGGPCVCVLPAESYVEFQLAAQAARPNGFVVVAGYGECGPGYVPVERAWEENDANLSDWCWVNPGSEKRLKEAITKALG